MQSFPKTVTPRDSRYLAWIRDMPCVVSGQTGEHIVAHHVRCFAGWGGVGLKPSDYRTIPLTSSLHLDLHQHGEESFWRRQGLDPKDCIVRLMKKYLVFNNVSFELLYFGTLEEEIEWLELEVIKCSKR